MKRVLVPLITCLIGIVIGFGISRLLLLNTEYISPVTGDWKKRPLDAYTIDHLSLRTPKGSPILIGEPIATESAYTVQRFTFSTDGKKVSGLAHIPRDVSGKIPVIVQCRGYVDSTIFESGIGTQRSAEVFAANGFLSLALDYLGYGSSDNPSANVFEERFQTYTTTVDLLASLASISFADTDHVFLWGHSNGGQIALTTLIISGKDIPTALWAPVTKPFPYSILYYTDEYDDGGNALRKSLAAFESQYDVSLYTMTNYLDRIRAPLQIHQGTGDDAVPYLWNDRFVRILEDKSIDVRYFRYPGADHNMLGAWNTVIERDIEFFRSFL